MSQASGYRLYPVAWWEMLDPVFQEIDLFLFPWTFADPITGVKVTGPTETLIAGNSSANISCMATAGSVQTTTWLKDGNPLAAGARVVFAADRSSVMISTLQKEDNGEFVCQLSNPVNKEQAAYKMVVNCECLCSRCNQFMVLRGCICSGTDLFYRTHSEDNKLSLNSNKTHAWWDNY